MKALTTVWSRAGAVIAATAVLLLATGADAAATHRAVPDDRATPWTAPLEQVYGALAKKDLRLAERAWHEAYLAALASWHWKGMMDVGDAYLRIGELSGARKAAEAKARQTYQAALFRARHQDSVDGLLRAAEAFAALGDREVAGTCVRLAESIAKEKGDAETRDRVSEFATRLAAMFAGMDLGVNAF